MKKKDGSYMIMKSLPDWAKVLIIWYESDEGKEEKNLDS